MQTVEIEKKFYDQIIKNRVTVLGGLNGEVIVVTVIDQSVRGMTKILLPNQKQDGKSN